jgi:uncharacterized phage protein (TIGR02218 family)
MIQSYDTILGESCWILPYTPDWRAGIETRFTLPADAERSLTGRESRRAYADRLRAEVAFESLLTAQEAATLRNALQSSNFENLPIWFPFWPGEWDFDPGYGSVFSSAQAIQWNSNGNAALVPDPANASGPAATAAKWIPALRGYFAETPTIEAITDELFVARFRLKEDGPTSLALQVNGSTLSYGPQISGRNYPVFPFRPQWRGPVETGKAEIEIDRRDMGFNREEVRVIYPQSPERALRFELSLHGNQSGADLIRFFDVAQGNAATFWCPTWMSEARLTGDVAAGATWLSVTNGNSLGSNAYIALVDRSGTTEIRQISGKTSTSVILAQVLAFAHKQGTTSLATAALVRFVRSGLTLRWRSTDEVEASVELKEAVTEYNTPLGENHGDTIGTLHRSCFLYRFTVEYPGTSQVWRFTSYEDSLEDASGTYTPQPIEHGEIRETLNLERNEVQLRTRAFTDNPLLRFIPFRLEFPMKLEVIEARLWPGGTTLYDSRRLFSGEVTKVQMDGPFITARAAQVGNLFERKLPRVLMQPTCNYALFDGACGLNKEDWKYHGFVLATLLNPTRIQLRNLARVTGTWVQPDLHWFAGGWIELGSGTDFESRFIADATAYNASGNGFIELTLSTPLGRTPSVGEEVFLFPGCDGKRGTCKDKFGNYSRFGGFPHMPVGNPSMVKMPANRNIK